MAEQPSRLRAGSLSFIEVLAASLALIGLSMTPVLIAPYMFGAAGNASWLAYVFGGIMLLLVAVNLNHFTSRSTGSGSMFLYAAKELGPAAGALAGWSLLWAYAFVGAAQFGAQVLFIGQLLATAHIVLPAIVVMAALGVTCYVLAVRDVALSTIVMLALEAVSVAIILVLVTVTLVHGGPHIDLAQLHLQGAAGSSIGLGIATAIFSLVGFESASAFGDEARRPLVIIPRAIIASVLIASAFFILAIYAEILGLRGSATSLDKLDAPLWSLADAMHVGYFKLPITIGAIFSSFSVALACVNTCARIMLPMASARVIPATLSAVQPKFKTPHVALAVTTIVMFLIGLVMYALRVAPIDIFNYCGTLSSLSFIVVYFMISVAAPLYLRRIGALRRLDIVVAALSCVFLIAAAITLFYPAPTPPTNYFPFAFLVYLGIGYALYRVARVRNAKAT